MAKHRVVISKRYWEEYERKGYRQSATSLKEAMGDAGYNTLMAHDPDSLLTLMVVEVYEAKHERLNQGERAFVLWGSYDSYEIAVVQVMERDPEEATVARADKDTMPWVLSTRDLYASRRECAAGNADYLRERIAAFRKAADNLEEFMVRIECPPAGEKQ